MNGQMGFGKCYHAFEVVKDGKRIVYWEQLARGEKPELKKNCSKVLSHE